MKESSLAVTKQIIITANKAYVRFAADASAWLQELAAQWECPWMRDAFLQLRHIKIAQDARIPLPDAAAVRPQYRSEHSTLARRSRIGSTYRSGNGHFGGNGVPHKRSRPAHSSEVRRLARHFRNNGPLRLC
jgi:hypothetical protein